MATPEHLLDDLATSGEHPSHGEHPAVALDLEQYGKGQGRGKGSRGGGRGGKKGAPREGNRETQVSKALSKILRHQAESQGLKLDAEGFVNVDDLLKCASLKSLKLTLPEIRDIVSSNEKKRFTLKLNPKSNAAENGDAAAANFALEPLAGSSSTSDNPSDYLIRANQGHSIAIESAALLSPITLELNNIPPIVIHGTFYAFYTPIALSGGLKPMGRNHIHFSTGLPEDKDGVISGMRKDAEILFYIDVRKSLEDNAALWWISDNGVVLTEGGEKGMVESKYWNKVVGRRQDFGVLWEDGVEVAELPQSVKERKAPSGKGQRGNISGRGGGGRGQGRGRGISGKTREMDIANGAE